MDKNTRSRHNTAYWIMRPTWQKYLDSKEPVEGTLARFLFRYQTEDDVEFAERLKRIAQVNFVDMAIHLYRSMIFSTTVQVSSEKYQEQVQGFNDSCNQQGDSLKDFFREMVVPSALLYGVTDVFVDLPQNSGEILTLEQQKAAGVDQPYCYIVPPLNRVDWAVASNGAYTYYRSEDVINTQIAAQFALQDPKQDAQWTETTEWRQDRIERSETQKGKQKNVVDDRLNPFSFIPAVAVIPLPSMRFYSDKLGLSLVKDVVPLQILLLNLISLMMDYHEQSNYAQRVWIQDTSNGDEPPTEGEIQESGPKRGITGYGRDTKYQILSPDPAGVEAMRMWMNDLIERVFQNLFIPSDSNVNKTHQSSQTIRSNHSLLYSRLTDICNHLSKTYKQVIETALKVQGLDPKEAKVSVQWQTNFSDTAFINALEELTQMRQAFSGLSDLAVAEFAKKVVAPALYNTGKLEAIFKQIEAFKNTPSLTVTGKGKGQAPQQDANTDPLRVANSEIRASEVAQEEDDETP